MRQTQNIGWRIPGFTELQELGAGSQGRAVLVRDDAVGRFAVAKYVVTAGEERAQEQFRRESVLLKRVNSPYVARWYGHFENAAVSAILMEAINGVSLKRLLTEHGRLAPESALLLLKGSLLGLAAAHEVGVVHRDYKPANVIVQADGLSKLIDFGVATITGEASRSGTPAYMAPEQWRGDSAGPETDVYAATCVFYECVTGLKPYEADRLIDVQALHLAGPIPGETAPPRIRDLLLRGMAKEPNERPATAAAFVDELEAAASAEYGQDWEMRGIAALSSVVAALTSLFPLSSLLLSPSTAAPVGGGTSGGQSALTAGRTARGVLSKVGTAKIAATAASAVAIGTAAVFVLTTKSRHTPAARPASLSSRLDFYNAALPDAGITVRRAPYPQIVGLADPVLAARVNSALRAPLDEQVNAFRQGILAKGTPTCRQIGSTLGTQVTVTLLTPKLSSVRYEFTETTHCWQGGIFNGSVTVDLRSGQVLRPADFFRSSVQATEDGLRSLDRRLTQHWIATRACEAWFPMTRKILEQTDGLAPHAITLTLLPKALEIRWGVGSADGCIAGPISIPYAQIKDLISLSVVSALPA